VAGTIGVDPGVKKPHYLTDAFHVPAVRHLKPHALQRPRSRHVRRMEDDRTATLAACVAAAVIVIPLAGNEALTAEILAALGDALDAAQLKQKTVSRMHQAPRGWHRIMLHCGIDASCIMWPTSNTSPL
jgi:hypothetical protein